MLSLSEHDQLVEKNVLEEDPARPLIFNEFLKCAKLVKQRPFKRLDKRDENKLWKSQWATMLSTVPTTLPTAFM